jgi:hypothetical protein
MVYGVQTKSADSRERFLVQKLADIEADLFAKTSDVTIDDATSRGLVALEHTSVVKHGTLLGQR